jgi:transposase
MGDRHIRQLLINGATAVQTHRPKNPSPLPAWSEKLSERKPRKVVSVAVTNKMARIAWAVMARCEKYRRSHVAIAV